MSNCAPARNDGNCGDSLSNVGRSRYSQGDLPYVEAIMKELLRWLGVVPTAVPHYLNEDDVYEGIGPLSRLP